MQVSVIVPAYNAEKYLPTTIASVQRQTVTDWELIIVNDGSTDNTAATAQSFIDDPRIQVLNKQNAGVAAARNAGFAMTSPSSQFICYLDADDVWEPETLEILLQALRAKPDFVGAHGLPCAIDEQGHRILPGELEANSRNRWAVEDGKLVQWPLDRPTNFACEVVCNCVQSPGAIMIRRAAHEKAGGFDERMGGCADWDLWLRLCRLGELAFINRALLLYRLHAENMSGRSKLMAEDELFLRKKLLSWPDETTERRQLAIWGYRYRSLQIFRYRMDWAKDALCKGRPLQALKQLRHATRMACLYALGPS